MRVVSRHASDGERRPARIFRIGSLLLIAALAAIAACPARAEPVSASGALGAEHFSGPDGQISRAVNGVVSLGIASAELIGGALRYDHSVVGQGSGLIAGAGVPLGPDAELLVIGTRFIGDGDYRAWRAKAGPRIEFARSSLGVYYLGEDNSLDGRSDGALAEGTTEWAPVLTGRVSAGYSAARSGGNAAYGAVGLGWRVARHLELNGELGMAQNAWSPGGVSPSPPRSVLDDLPIIGGGGGGGSNGASEPDDRARATALVSVRVPFP